MNCANHVDLAAVAFCRTCGKPLCQSCVRDVRGVIYCEECLAAKLEGKAAAPYVPPQQAPIGTPAAGFAPGQTQSGFTPVAGYAPGPQATYSPGPASSGPNPAIAGILSGFFPIGVGAVYCGQYTKGLAHLVIMVLLILGVSSNLPWFVITVLGILIGFFYVYQIIDAVRTAHAIQAGQPAPDPFGLAETFGGAGVEKLEGAKIPLGASILIGLGVLFLLNTAGVEFGLDRFWPLILIFLGVWLFAKNWGLIGNKARCQCERCRTHKLMGPSILITLGVLFLLDSVSRLGFGRTWPAILLVIGVVKLAQSNASAAGHVGPLPAPGCAPGQSMPAVAPPSAPIVEQPTMHQAGSETSGSGEVHNG